MVRSLGYFPPCTEQSATWPDQQEALAYIGPGETEDVVYDCNLTAYYEVLSQTPIVDLDVDANWDGGPPSVGEPDDAMETSNGGIVPVGGRTEIAIRKTDPESWSGTLVLTKESDKIEIYESATGGSPLDIGEGYELPNEEKTLYGIRPASHPVDGGPKGP